jgi:hypothetical protein
LPKGLKKIGVEAFCECSNLKSIVLPDSIKEIKRSAFKGCSSLTSIVIPRGIESLGEYVFEGCSSLVSITVESYYPPEVEEGVLLESFKNITVYVPKESVDIYRNSDDWSIGFSIKPIESNNDTVDIHSDRVSNGSLFAQIVSLCEESIIWIIIFAFSGIGVFLLAWLVIRNSKRRR